ncbi:MAG: CARDB domain-containing protein [Candidatus Thalassarchaeaceae archaeon]
MAGRREACLVVISILFLSTIQSVQAVTVVKADSVDLMPPDALNNATLWELSSSLNDTIPAHYSTISIEESGMVISHLRPENSATSVAWASTSSTNSVAATGIPDGGVAVSKGPDIKISGFDHSLTSSNMLLNLSLSLILTIPDVLSDDEVRFVVDRGDGPLLLHTIRHTFAATEYTQSSPLLLPLFDEDDPWTWADIEQTEVLVDYVSVNGIDDSELQLDAVAVLALHRSPWYAFETTTALHTTNPIDMPVMDFNSLSGEIESLSISSCGLEPSSSSPGVWNLEDIERPFNQQWGRVHITGIGNNSIQIKDTMSETWTTVLDGNLIEINQDSIDIQITIFDGCISNFRIDINDPSLHVSYRIEGNDPGLVPSFSSLRFAVGGSLVQELSLTNSNGTFSVPIGHLLGKDGESLEIGVGSRFQWSSDGSPQETTVVIESMMINGGYIVEFDLDPQCQNIDDQIFNEDDPGRYIPFRYYCNDDITESDNLTISAISSNSDILVSSIVGDEILLMPQIEMSGAVTVDILVTDVRGNTWSDQINVMINEINDPPTLSGLLTSVYIEVGTEYQMTLNIQDIDSTSLSVSTDRDWANIEKSNEHSWVFTLTPTESGQTFVTIFIEDEDTRINQTIEVISTSTPDLSIESIDAIVGDQTLSTPISVENGDVVSFRILVRNTGSVEVTSVGVECSVENVSVPGEIIPSISPGGLGTVICYWSASGEGEVRMTANVDANGLIDEFDEFNNIRTLVLTVSNEDKRSDPFTIVENTDGSTDNIPILLLAITIVGLAAAAFFFGPKKIDRPYTPPKERSKQR